MPLHPLDVVLPIQLESPSCRVAAHAKVIDERAVRLSSPNTSRPARKTRGVMVEYRTDCRPGNALVRARALSPMRDSPIGTSFHQSRYFETVLASPYNFLRGPVAGRCSALGEAMKQPLTLAPMRTTITGGYAEPPIVRSSTALRALSRTGSDCKRPRSYVRAMRAHPAPAEQRKAKISR